MRKIIIIITKIILIIIAIMINLSAVVALG